MNAHDPAFGKSELAQLHYGDGEFVILRPGKYVLCAVTAVKIPLQALRYWNPTLQEAYAGPDIALKRWQELQRG